VAGLAAVPVEKIARIVCMRGSGFSHTAVFARALAIPSVMGVGDLPLDALEGRSIVVDGYQGRIFIQPSHAILEEYQQLARQEEKLSAELRVLRDVAAETRDGVRVPLHIKDFSIDRELLKFWLLLS
jgi:phosphotransferase system enzyme I (PtsP)